MARDQRKDPDAPPEDVKQYRSKPSLEQQAHRQEHVGPEEGGLSARERAVAATRRTVLKGLTVAAGALAVLAAAIPAAVAAVWPARRRTVRSPEGAIDAAPLAAIKDGEPLKVDLVAPDAYDAWLHRSSSPLGAVYLQKNAAGTIDCFSSVCPHLGCFVEYEGAKKEFACPCHGSSWQQDGTRIGGPTPRDLDRLRTVVEGERVKVEWVRYMNNTPDRVKI